MLFIKGLAFIAVLFFVALRLFYRKINNPNPVRRNSDYSGYGTGKTANSTESGFKKSSLTSGKTLVFDIETTGLPRDLNADLNELRNWPRIVSIGWFLFDQHGALIEEYYSVIKQKYKVPAAAERIHGISKEVSLVSGRELSDVLEKTLTVIYNSSVVVAHNLEFDLKILQACYVQNGYAVPFTNHQKICTMKSTVDYCAIPRGRGFKYPRLEELAEAAFPYGHRLEGASLHNSKVDAELTAMCYFKLYATIQANKRY